MKVSEMFPGRYASAAELEGRAIEVRIDRAVQEQMRPGGGPLVDKWVLYVSGGHKGIVLSRMLAQQIAQVLGQDDTDAWKGRAVVLYPERITVAGRDSVAFRARAAGGQGKA